LLGVEGGKVEQRQAERGRRKSGDLGLLELLAEDELFDESDPGGFRLGLGRLRVVLGQEAPAAPWRGRGRTASLLTLLQPSI